MFSSKLFWKVTFYFALLLVILSATTVVTLYFLRQIQSNYSQASVDMSTTSSLDRVRELIIDIQSAADEYMYTGLPEKRTAYDKCWKEFDNEIVSLQKSYKDSIDLQTLKQIRSSFYAWVANIGDKKILFATSNLNNENLGKEIHSLGSQQSSNRYLESALMLVHTLYQQRLTSVPKNIENSIELSKNIASFIVLVNVLIAIFAIVLGFILTRSITKPVKQLRGGTQNIMQGVFEPITLHQRDEFGDLASDFNQMSTMLHNNYNRLTAYSELMTALN
jgi:nitrogen fixation/metabolism regulation signal transduction histidine kinase